MRITGDAINFFWVLICLVPMNNSARYRRLWN